MKVSVIWICVFFLTILSFSFGQEAEEPTVEEIYLQSAEIRLIREQAVTVDRDMKLLALQNLKNMIEDGRVSTGSPEAHYILDYLAVEGIGNQIRENRRVINYFPMVRKEACYLLGELGGEISKDTLLDVLNQEDEPMVKAEAAYALGKIGINENDEVARALSYSIINQDAVNPDSNFAFAVLLSFEKIAKANEGIEDPEAFRAIIRIAQGNYVRDVKRKAIEVMDLLRQYQ